MAVAGIFSTFSGIMGCQALFQIVSPATVKGIVFTLEYINIIHNRNSFLALCFEKIWVTVRQAGGYLYFATFYDQNARGFYITL